MWNAAEFKKATGVSPDATPEALATALTNALKRETDAGISQALLCFKLKDLGWQATEAQASYGFGPTTYAVAAARGAIVYACGAAEAHRTWLHVRALGTADGILTTVYNALLGIQESEDENGKPITAEANRSKYVANYGTRRIIAARLGDNASEEAIDTIAKAAAANGLDMPKSVRDAIPGLAKHHEIPLPEVKRQTKSADASAAKVPTTAEAKAMLEAVQADRLAGGEAEAYRDDEVADLQAILARAARMLVAGQHMTPYQVADFVAAHLDEVAEIQAPLPAMQTGTVA